MGCVPGGYAAGGQAFSNSPERSPLATEDEKGSFIWDATNQGLVVLSRPCFPWCMLRTVRTATARRVSAAVVVMVLSVAPQLTPALAHGSAQSGAYACCRSAGGHQRQACSMCHGKRERGSATAQCCMKGGCGLPQALPPSTGGGDVFTIPEASNVPRVERVERLTSVSLAQCSLALSPDTPPPKLS
jgi:hypothetical protein